MHMWGESVQLVQRDSTEVILGILRHAGVSWVRSVEVAQDADLLLHARFLATPSIVFQRPSNRQGG